MSEVNLLQKSDELAYIFFQNKMYELAVMQAEITLKMNPLNPNSFFNAARCHYYNLNYDKAIEYIRVVLLLDPQNENAKRELSLYLSWFGKEKESISILKELPQDSRTKFNLGWYELKKGHLKEGFALLENGRGINCWGHNDQFPLKKWKGDNITGKKLLVINEGGYGDEIIFTRFLFYLVGMGVDVSVKPSKEMISVFKRFDKIKVVDEPVFDEYDYWIPSMSLPFVLGIESLSGSSYLTPSEDYVIKWKQKINGDKLKIGLRWQGGSLYEYHQRRSIPVNDLISSIQGHTKIYSLQKESDTACPDGVINLHDQLETWEDTIAVISLMDVVVTSCTAIAHIAGALGKKTFVIVPVLSYFTWAKPGNKSDWYNSITIFRQGNPYSWDEPINEVCHDLEQIINTCITN